jgi:hypothetical protein
MVPAAHGAPESLELRSLAPKYSEADHGIYVQALVRAIEDEPTMRNIALTGAYGTGKSSVLTKVADRYPQRVLTLSLSTVGFDEEILEGDSDASPAARTKTNLIQKEIVKQILYRDAPGRMRGSRFRRIARFRLTREAWGALGGAVPVLAFLYLTQLSKKLVSVAGKGPTWSAGAAYAGLFVLIAGVILALRWLTYNRLFLEKLTAGPATVSLTSQSSSFFDQYMDEIVYYFEQSGRDIVIFEDIDRFEDVHIFETLRALNTLLNGSDQVRHRKSGPKRPRQQPAPDVKFIYALRDSVFEKLGTEGEANIPLDAADDEIKRANRTKFFDLVIPVVPFITHRNARDLMSEELHGTGISAALIHVAARHVADKRLIVNMRNEYDIYANRLLGTQNRMPGLDADKLFALILYKSVHMADFEAIRLGKSQLDKLHDAWRDLVGENLAAAMAGEREAGDKLAAGEMAASRAAQLGDRLEEIARALFGIQPYPGNYYVQVGPQVRTGELKDPGLWKEVATAWPGIVVGNSATGRRQDLSFEQLQRLMGVRIDAAEWQPLDEQEHQRAQQAARKDIAFLRHHSWADIYNRPAFKADVGGPGEESFAEMTGRLLESRLARDLVANGYINDYFALYISVYYGNHLTLDALNFMVHALDQGRSDIAYRLEPEDVDAILRDKGDGILLDRAIYNISILDHLLATDESRAKTVIRQISAWGREDQKFAGQYVAAGTRIVDFVRLLTPFLPHVVVFTVEEAPVSPEQRAALVDAALSHQSDDVNYLAANGLADFILSNYTKFDSITSGKRNLRRPTTIRAIAAANVNLPDVAPLNGYARDEAVKYEAYALTEHNLQALIGEEVISLDALRGANKRVYETALAQLDTYLEIVRASHPRQFTISSPGEFTTVLGEADQAADEGDDSSMLEIVQLAAKECRADALPDAPQRSWPALAVGQRTSPSAANLLAYLNAFGEIDENIGVLLADVHAIADIERVAASERARLATAILNAHASIPSSRERVALARSLDIETMISPQSLVSETGELVGRLIEAGLIADDETTFARAHIPDWRTREYAIRKSKTFGQFMSPDVLPSKDLGGFFSSQNIPGALKDKVLAHLGAFSAGASRQSYQSAADYAIGSGARLTISQLETLKAGRASHDTLVSLLAAAQLPDGELRTFLRSLGGNYETIADPGKRSPRVPDDAAHREVLDRLKSADVVSGYRPDKGQLRVSLRRS